MRRRVFLGTGQAAAPRHTHAADCDGEAKAICTQRRMFLSLPAEHSAPARHARFLALIHKWNVARALRDEARRAGVNGDPVVFSGTSIAHPKPLRAHQQRRAPRHGSASEKARLYCRGVYRAPTTLAGVREIPLSKSTRCLGVERAYKAVRNIQSTAFPHRLRG